MVSSHDPILSSTTDGGDTGPNEPILPTTIHSLPPEIMMEIFHLTFDKPCLVTWPHLHGPWLLERVCARWRDLVVSCSSLWASFDTTGGLQDAWSRTTAVMTQRALSLSTTYPLTFIAGTGLGDLIKHASRWREATLFESILQDIGRGLTVNDFPILERLHLGFNSTGDSWPRMLRLFANAPQLKTLILSGTVIPARFPTTRQELRAITSPFEWGSLSHLTIALDFSWMSYIFIQCCPNLFSFRDLSRQDNWLGKEDWPVLRHRCLRVLHSNNPAFLGRIRCTALEEFSIPLVPGEDALSRAAPLFPARALTFILDNRTALPFIETNIQSAIKRISRQQGSARLCLDVRRASFRPILVLCKHIAAHSTIFPYMSHLVLRLSHQASVCSEDSLCLLSSPADASALGVIMYEPRLRDSPERLNLVTFEVTCPMKKCPDCVKDFITQFRQLKPSTVNVEFFMLSQSTEDIICGRVGFMTRGPA